MNKPQAEKILYLQCTTKQYAIVCLFFLIAFILLTVFVFTGRSSFDSSAIQQMQAWERGWLTRCMLYITFLGNYQFLVPANLLLIFFLLYRKQKRTAWLTLLAAITSLGWKFLLKDLFRRPRPASAMLEGIKNFSYPSGHAMMGLAFYGLLILLINKTEINKWLKHFFSVSLLLLILLIGCSRIYLRVHYLTDVLAGYFFSIFWICLCLYISSGIKKN